VLLGLYSVTTNASPIAAVPTNKTITIVERNTYPVGPSGHNTITLYHGTCAAYVNSLHNEGPRFNGRFGDFSYKGTTPTSVYHFRSCHSFLPSGGFYLTNTFENAAAYVKSHKYCSTPRLNPTGYAVVGKDSATWIPHT
jgi:hypothetical protein